MNPASKTFFILTIVLLALAVMCLVTGQTTGGIVVAIFGVLGLLAHFRSKKS